MVHRCDGDTATRSQLRVSVAVEARSGWRARTGQSGGLLSHQVLRSKPDAHCICAQDQVVIHTG
jgi:hypothetical protein